MRSVMQTTQSALKRPSETLFSSFQTAFIRMAKP
uniref:Uncharacterized protein n=1 Tax=Neisseria meningitidis alpha522 TaxID=996307 RepID=I4E847_NEIME|nr:hypothetical protein NMALPHA522_1974 [Neisseria meningitidis alpha522]